MTYEIYSGEFAKVNDKSPVFVAFKAQDFINWLADRYAKFKYSFEGYRVYTNENDFYYVKVVK